jgi:iron(III) transport system permease protein
MTVLKPPGTPRRIGRAGSPRSPLRGFAGGPLVVWLLLLGLVGSPILMLVAISLNGGDPGDLPPQTYGFVSYTEIGQYAEWIKNSLVLATLCCLIATGLGAMLAWLMARTDLPGKGWLQLLIILPYPMGPMVAAVAWSALGAPRGGLLNRTASSLVGSDVTIVNTYSVAGIIIVQALVQTPICFMLIQSALSGMDASLEESSAVLGAGKLTTALKVTFPLMLPAVVGAALFTFVSALGAFAIPSVLGQGLDFKVATQAVYQLFGSFTPNYPRAAAVGVILIVVSSVLVAAANAVLRRRTYAVIGGKSRAPRPVQLGRWRAPAQLLVFGYIAVGVLLPLAVLAVASVQATTRLSLDALTFTWSNYRYILLDYPLTRQSVVNSIVLGIATGLVGVALATLIAMTVERNRRRGRGGKFMELVTMAPQAVPRLIFSLALLVVILVLPLHIYGSLVGILAAFIVVFLPLAYRGVAGVVTQVDASLEEAAHVLGASQARAVRDITLPLIRPGLISSGVLLFMLSLTEVGAALMLSGPRSSVLGPTLFNFYDSGGLPRVATLALVQVAIVGVAILIVRRVSGRWAVL